MIKMNENEELLANTIQKSDIFDDGEVKSKILSVLALRNNMTMTKIEKSCGISEPIASQNLSDLKDEGYVVESHTIASGVGRPQTVYDLTENWIEKLNNVILDDIGEKLNKARVINSILSDKSGE